MVAKLSEDRMPGGEVQQAVRSRLEEERKEKKDRRKWALGTAALLLLIFLLTRVFFGIAVVEGNSMNPNYMDSDLVLFTRVHGTPHRGDVVLVQVDDQVLIKRVVGLPGEEVYIDQRTGSVMINGEELEEDYTQGSTRRNSIEEYPITLGEDEYFVLGDNREDSMDSRDYGPVSSAQIEGEILVILRKG